MIIYKKWRRAFYWSSIFFIFFVELSFCQVKVGDWNSLTSSLQIRDVQLIENTLYSSTEGGILSIKENDYSVITNTNGLIGVDLLSIAKDNNNNLWVGGNSPLGFLQLYDPLIKEYFPIVNSCEFLWRLDKGPIKPINH